MKFYIYLLPFLLTACVTSSKICEHPNSAYDRSYCQAKLFLHSDEELNETYQLLIKNAAPDKKKHLVAKELKWMKHRERNCLMDGDINLECNLKMNQERIAFLKMELQESKSKHAIISNQIKPRRTDFGDCGYRNTSPSEGWYDAQGQGESNDYCRYVGNQPHEPGSHNNWFACALAGEKWSYSNVKKYTDTSPWLDTYQPLEPGDKCN